MKKLVELHHALYRVTDLLPIREPLRKMLRENANALLTYIVEADLTRISANADFAQINAGERRENNTGNAEFPIKISAKIEAMQNTLSATKELGYCHPVNFEVLEREYDEIRRYFEIRQEEEKKVPFAQDPSAIQTGETLNKKEDDFVRVFEGGVAEIPEEKKKETVEPTVQEPTVKQAQSGNSAFNDRQQAIVSFIKERKEVKSIELATIFSNRFSLKTLQRDLATLIGQKVIDKQGEKRWAVYRMNGFY